MQDYFRNFGVYVHVPFCQQNCSYCRFYKRAPSDEDIGEYLHCISLEIDSRDRENGAPLPVPQTMFWGGGTPSCLSPDQIKRLSDILAPLRPTLEWTVEVAPSSASPEKLRALKEIGVTRISMGVQSFNPKTLASLGRKHSLERTLRAIGDIADQSFPHFSIDLIFGADGQSQQEWISDIQTAARQPVDHISAYCLEFESGSSACCGRGDSQPGREREADFYEIASRALPSLGFKQYEISNYSKPGCQCVHNLSTWHMAQWIGLGPAAASQWKNFRMRNSPSFEKWSSGLRLDSPCREDIVELDDEEMFSSALVFGLRMNDGVDLPSLERRFPKADFRKHYQSLAFLKEEGLVELESESESPGRIRLTASGRLMADAVAVELL